MSFEAKIVERQFAEDFLSKVAQNRSGSFAGSVEGRERVAALLREADFNSAGPAAAVRRPAATALSAASSAGQRAGDGGRRCWVGGDHETRSGGVGVAAWAWVSGCGRSWVVLSVSG